MLTVSFSRTILGLSPLVFSSDPTGGLWIPEDGIGRPGQRKRRTYAGESPWLAGSTLIASALEQSSLPVSLYVQGSTTAARDALMAEVEACFDQFTYRATVTINGGAPVTWECDPADVDWGTVDSGVEAAFMATAQVVVPVFPIPVGA